MIYTSALECKHVTWHLLKKSKRCWARLQKAKHWLPSTSSSSLYYRKICTVLSTLCKKQKGRSQQQLSLLSLCADLLQLRRPSGAVWAAFVPCVSCCSLWTRRIHRSHQLCFKFFCKRIWWLELCIKSIELLTTEHGEKDTRCRGVHIGRMAAQVRWASLLVLWHTSCRAWSGYISPLGPSFTTS